MLQAESSSKTRGCGIWFQLALYPSSTFWRIDLILFGVAGSARHSVQVAVFARSQSTAFWQANAFWPMMTPAYCLIDCSNLSPYAFAQQRKSLCSWNVKIHRGWSWNLLGFKIRCHCHIIVARKLHCTPHTANWHVFFWNFLLFYDVLKVLRWRVHVSHLFRVTDFCIPFNFEPSSSPSAPGPSFGFEAAQLTWWELLFQSLFMTANKLGREIRLVNVHCQRKPILPSTSYCSLKFTLANRSQGRRFIADIALHRSFKKGNLSSKLWSGAEWWHPSTFAGIVNQALSNLDSDDSNLHSHKWLHSHPVQNIYSTYRILALLIRRSQCAKLILARTGKTHPFHPQIIAVRKFQGKCGGLCLGLALAYHTSSHQLPPSFTLSKKRVVIGPCPVPWHCPPSKFLVGKRHGDRDVELRLDAMLNKTWWLHTAPFTAASRSVPLCSNPAAQKGRPCQDMFVLPMQVSGASQQC